MSNGASVKQNRRTDKDPNTRDWKPVGECSGILSMRLWFDRYVSMSSWEHTEMPFFYDENGPCVYHKMLRLFRQQISHVAGMTWELACVYGFHGLRVLGYNCWRAASGEEVAVLQGGWGSDAHRSYSREMLQRILSMASKGAQYAAMNALPAMPLDKDLPPLPPPQLPRVVAEDHVFTAGAGPSDAPAPAPAAPASSRVQVLPHGALCVPHSTTKAKWKTFKFNGKTYRSLSSLWKAVDDAPGSFVSSLTNYSF